MKDVDVFSRILLEESKHFLEKSQVETNEDGKLAYLHASLALGFSALEAHVNGIADDFLTRKDLPIMEQSLLAEQDFKLENGEFSLTGQLRMYRLEDRIQFLYRKFSGEPLDKNASWWSELKAGINLRNKLTHPKEAPRIDEAAIQRVLNAIIDTLDALYKAVYKIPYPVGRRGLQSTMTF
jgi:hypothetical protein